MHHFRMDLMWLMSSCAIKQSIDVLSHIAQMVLCASQKGFGGELWEFRCWPLG